MPHPNLRLKPTKAQRQAETAEDEREFWIFRDAAGRKFAVKKGKPIRFLAEKLGPKLWKPVIITLCWGEVEVTPKEWKRMTRKLGLSPAEPEEEEQGLALHSTGTDAGSTDVDTRSDEV